MANTRIWNVTNDPGSDVAPQNLMVLGKVLKPGQSMLVDEEGLKTAHKIKKDVGAKLLLVSKTAPAYLSAGARASLPASLPRAHVEPPKSPVAKAAPAKADAPKVEEPAAEEKSDGLFGGKRKGK